MLVVGGCRCRWEVLGEVGNGFHLNAITWWAPMFNFGVAIEWKEKSKLHAPLAKKAPQAFGSDVYLNLWPRRTLERSPYAHTLTLILLKILKTFWKESASLVTTPLVLLLPAKGCFLLTVSVTHDSLGCWPSIHFSGMAIIGWDALVNPLMSWSIKMAFMCIALNGSRSDRVSRRLPRKIYFFASQIL